MTALQDELRAHSTCIVVHIAHSQCGDLVDAAAIAVVEKRIRAINPYAKIVHSARCDVPLDQVIGLDAFNLERVLETEPGFLTDDHDYKHEEDITSISLSANTPLDHDRFQSWFGNLIQRCGPYPR